MVVQQRSAVKALKRNNQRLDYERSAFAPVPLDQTRKAEAMNNSVSDRQPEIYDDIASFIRANSMKVDEYHVLQRELSLTSHDLEYDVTDHQTFKRLSSAVEAFQSLSVSRYEQHMLIANTSGEKTVLAWKEEDGHIDPRSDSWLAEGEEWGWKSVRGGQTQKNIPTAFEIELRGRQAKEPKRETGEKRLTFFEDKNPNKDIDRER